MHLIIKETVFKTADNSMIEYKFGILDRPIAYRALILRLNKILGLYMLIRAKIMETDPKIILTTLYPMPLVWCGRNIQLYTFLLETSCIFRMKKFTTSKFMINIVL